MEVSGIPSSSRSNTTSTSFAVPGSVPAGDLEQHPNPLYADTLASLGDTIVPLVRPSNMRSKSSQYPAPALSISSAPTLAILSTNPSMQASCQCLTSALSLLETLTIESARPSAPNVARILHFKKRALVQCNTLLDCERCSSVSSFIILLVVFCEKMITSYERILAVLMEQFKLRHGQELDAASTSPERDEERQMAVKDYDLDIEEQPCVFGGLASMQMRKLKIFLARVRAVLKQWNCDQHVMMVDSVEDRLQQQLLVFDKSSNEH